MDSVARTLELWKAGMMDESPPGSASSPAPTPPPSTLHPLAVVERPSSLRALTSNGQPSAGQTSAGQISAGQISGGQTSGGQTSHVRGGASSSRVVNHAGVPVAFNDGYPPHSQTPYRGTSLIRNSPPPQDHHRGLGIVLM